MWDDLEVRIFLKDFHLANPNKHCSKLLGLWHPSVNSHPHLPYYEPIHKAKNKKLLMYKINNYFSTHVLFHIKLNEDSLSKCDKRDFLKN
jgi:hypothetical protein